MSSRSLKDILRELTILNYDKLFVLKETDEIIKRIHDNNIRKIYKSKIKNDYPCITSTQEIYSLLKKTDAYNKLSIKKSLIDASFCNEYASYDDLLDYNDVTYSNIERIFEFLEKYTNTMEIRIIYKIYLYKNVYKCFIYAEKFIQENEIEENEMDYQRPTIFDEDTFYRIIYELLEDNLNITTQENIEENILEKWDLFYETEGNELINIAESIYNIDTLELQGNIVTRNIFQAEE